VLINREQLVHQKSAQGFFRRSCPLDEQPDPAAQLNNLRRYQRGELLRIGACDLLDMYDLPAVTGQLSNLADGMARACLSYASTCSNIDPAGFVVLAMGKLGGSELNYSSDIDLLFLCANNGVDYLRLGQQFIDALAT